jgi:DNA-binding SARP family transcriptional activator
MWLVRAFGALDIRDAGGQPPPSLQVQPKRIALLAYLVLMRPGELHRRDSLLALFWPELDQSHGRNALSQALSFLRRQLGRDVLVTRGNEEVGVAADRVRSDVADFEDALASGDCERALDVYAGDFLEGLHVQGAAPFVDWVDRERARLREAAADAAWRCAAERLAAGKPTDAERAAQRALGLVPTDESRVREFVDGLANAGDRAAALRFYEKFAAALATELEVEPAPETVAFVEAVRTRSEPAQVVTVVTSTATPLTSHTASEGRLAQAYGTPTPVPLRRWRWWGSPRHRAGIGGVIVLGALLLGGYGIMREPRTSAPDTLIGEGVVPRYVKVVVADFTSPEDPQLGLTVAELLREKIDESDIVRPVDAPALGAALRRMERDSSAPLDAATAREIAVRDGYPLVIAGPIERVGDTYVLAARLEAAANDTVLGRFHTAVPASGPDLVDAVDRMGNDIRARIGESLSSIKRSPPLEKVTTHSLEALRLYTAAVRLATREGRPLDAAPLLERAITVDTTFATAYRTLESLLNQQMTQWARQEELSRKVYQYRDRLPEYDRFQLEADYTWYRLIRWRGPPSEAPDECGINGAAYGLTDAYVRRHPEDIRPLGEFALYQQRTGRLADALATYRRLLALGPSDDRYYAYLSTQLKLGRFEAAERTYREWRERLGESGDLLLAEETLAARQGDYDRADSAASRHQVQYGHGEPEATVDQGDLDAARGRLKEAWAHYAHAIQRVEESGELAEPVRWIANRALMRLVALGDSATAVREVTAAVDRVPAGNDLAGTWVNVGLVYALAGDTSGARRALDTLRATGRGNWSMVRGDLAAAIALAEGEPRRALQLLQAADIPCTFNPSVDLRADPRLRRVLAGRAYDALHDTDEAIATYSRYFTDLPLAHPAHLDAAFLFDILERLGRLHEARGDGALAVSYYTRAARLWRNADAPLQPRVEEVRNRAAAVSALRPSSTGFRQTANKER